MLIVAVILCCFFTLILALPVVTRKFVQVGDKVVFTCCDIPETQHIIWRQQLNVSGVSDLKSTIVDVHKSMHNGRNTNGRYSASLHAMQGEVCSNLTISDAQLNDSGIYYCQVCRR